MEVLGSAIRQNKNIRGVQIADIEIKSGQFADDLWTISPYSQQNINETLQELSRFQEFSGLRLNADKTAVLCLGPHKDSEAKLYTLKRLYWSPGSVKILGIDISADLNKIREENYNQLLEKVDKILDNCTHRNLTLIGKVTIINSLINSLFMYKLLALPTPSNDFF